MAQPVITNQEGKFQLKYDIGLDSDADGAKALSVAVVIEADQKEVIDELLKKVMAGKEIPAWLKSILGMA